MKRLRLRSQIFALMPALLLSWSAFAQEEEHSPVQKEMESINRNMRKLSRQAADPAQKDSSLQLIADIQKSADTAKTLTPSKAEKLSGEEKTKYLGTYKKDMEAFNKELVALKDAVQAGDKDKSKAELDKINQLKMSSHKELGVKMGPGGGGPRGPGGPGGAGGGPGGPRRNGPPGGGGDQQPPAAPQQQNQ